MSQEELVRQGLDFILSHFKEPAVSLFPRKIYTKTLDKPIWVNNKEEAVARFKQSNFVDCRINAYLDHLDRIGKNTQAPDFIFIDLDKSQFTTHLGLKLSLHKTLKNIQKEFACMPTILWSGNGYHIYLPIDGVVLEDYKPLAKYNNPSTKTR